MQQSTSSLSEKIQSLPPGQLAEVEDFVATLEFHAALKHASVALSEPSFATIWNNPEDDTYDSL